MDAIDIEKDFGAAIIKNTARKMIDKYVPPIALVEDTSFDDAMQVATFEEIADVGGIQPAIRVFYELDCSKTMVRELSIEVFKVDGRIGSKHSASESTPKGPRTLHRSRSNEHFDRG
jgi:hypothetical protein